MRDRTQRKREANANEELVGFLGFGEILYLALSLSTFAVDFWHFTRIKYDYISHDAPGPATASRRPVLFDFVHQHPEPSWRGVLPLQRALLPVLQADVRAVRVMRRQCLQLLLVVVRRDRVLRVLLKVHLDQVARFAKQRG